MDINKKGNGFQKVSLRSNKKELLKKLISRPLIILWISGILFVAVTSLIPQASLSDVNSNVGIDKLARIITFAFLGFLPIAFFSSIKLGLCLSSSMPPLGFLLELVQRYVPGRHFSPEDIIANNIGAVIGIILAVIIRIIFRTGRLTKKRDIT